LYKFETLVPFEVLPLRLYVAIPALLPMLSRAASDSLAALDSISVEDFRQHFQHWERRWDCCIQSQGEHFEGDWSFKLLQILLKFFLLIPWILGPPTYIYIYNVHVYIHPLKVSTRDFSWGKCGQCVWLTTYHPCSAETKSGVLTYPEPLEPPRPVAGDLYFFFLLLCIHT